MKVVRLPPYTLAMLASYVHGTCQLCRQAIITNQAIMADMPKGVLYRAPLLCQHCHQAWVGNLPVFGIEVADSHIPLYVASHYDTPLKHVMSAFKDKGEVSALLVLYHLLRFIKLPPKLNATNTVLIPVPTTNSRLAERGFNPVGILTRYLSFLWQIPIWQGIGRIDNEVHQRGLGRDDRLNNVKEDFYVVEALPTRHVILVDDVVTTGSTLSAMTHALMQAFPKTAISAVCVLHGRKDMHLPIFRHHAI